MSQIFWSLTKYIENHIDIYICKQIYYKSIYSTINLTILITYHKYKYFLYILDQTEKIFDSLGIEMCIYVGTEGVYNRILISYSRSFSCKFAQIYTKNNNIHDIEWVTLDM